MTAIMPNRPTPPDQPTLFASADGADPGPAPDVAPVTPDAPFEVIMAMPRMPSSCQIVRCVLVACARNSVASVM